MNDFEDPRNYSFTSSGVHVSWTRRGFADMQIYANTVRIFNHMHTIPSGVDSKDDYDMFSGPDLFTLHSAWRIYGNTEYSLPAYEMASTITTPNGNVYGLAILNEVQYEDFATQYPTEKSQWNFHRQKVERVYKNSTGLLSESLAELLYQENSGLVIFRINTDYNPPRFEIYKEINGNYTWIEI